MALFEDESIDDIEDETNVYLDCPEKGIGLIKSLLLREKKEDEHTEFDEVLSDKIFPVLAELDLEDELEIYKELIKIRDKVREQQKIKLLAGKKVLGIGGRFSSGKSCFINSITNAELPVGQRPTTSIATYIVNAKEKKNVAISNSDSATELDDEALEALTHKFFEKYQIGFSRVVKNLVVYTPGFTYPNVAILDTPGYSKADISKRNDSSDEGMAREQLKSVDYLIWLVDSVQGVITQGDLEFLSSLNISSEILIIFTKASMETKENLMKKIETAKDALQNISKAVYDVIAYDSETKEEIVGSGVLERFLTMVNGADADSEDIVGQIHEMDDQLQRQIKDQQMQTAEQKQKLGDILKKSCNIEHISAIVREYGKCCSMLNLLEESKDKLTENFEKLTHITNAMLRCEQ